MTTSQQHRLHQDLKLPQPQTFDILPALHEILARIDHGSASTDPLDPNHTMDVDAADLGALYTDLQPLEPKELPTEVLQIKAKIRRALKELEKLPDMDRSVAEQEEEIKELEERIRKQDDMTKRLGALAKEVQQKLG
jgi:hypothetical protein